MSFPRKPTDSPVLNTIGAHKGNHRAFPSKGGKKLHKGIPKKNHDKVHVQDAIDQKEQEQLAKQLEQLLLNQVPTEEEQTERVPPVAFERPLSLSQNIYKSWKSDIAHQSRNAVVKILSSVIEFDWQHPFKRSDMGDAIGTGFFVDNDGTFVTNAHVIEEAARIWITIPSEGEKRYPAEVLGVCFDVDLAVLRAKNAPVSKILEFGDSNAVQYGQEVLTLGYPLGMDSLKLTEGIISGREEGLFQTDAPLNPGNSGGPMLNSEGKVIGINVAIVEKSQNVGFAIPVFHLVQLYEALRTRPKDKLVVHKPILGCDWSNSSDALMRFSGSSQNPQGIFISKSYEGFPLYNAGVRDGDILHSFNGFALDNFGHAVVPWSPYARASIDSLIALCAYDSKPEITYSREGKIFKSTVSFEDPDNKGVPKLPAIREYYPPYEKIDYVVIAGMVVMDLTLNHIQELHESSPTQNVLKTLTPIAISFEERLKPSLIIADVLVGSLVARDNVFPPGTLLTEVNGIKVSTLSEFRSAVMKPISKNGELFLTFRSKSSEFAVLPLQEVFREEFELSEMYMYNISPLVLESLAANPSMVDYCTKGDKQSKKRFQALLKAHREGDKVDDAED